MTLYFVQSGSDGPIKIGWTRSPLQVRLCNLQEGNPVTLHLRATRPGGPTEERRLHERFAADRIRGEWFRPSAALLAEIGRR